MQHEDFERLVENLAGHLPGWTVELDGAKNSVVFSKDGLSFCADEDRDYRLVFSPLYGDLGRFIPYGASRPRITVSPERSPQAIVKDVERRFLPDFVALIRECQKRKDLTDRANAQARENADALFSVSGGILTCARHVPQDMPIKMTGYLKTNVYIEAKVGDKKVDLNLSGLSPGLAEAIVALVVRDVGDSVR